MAADWITPDSIALVREMAIANISNANIAVAVSKRFGQPVNPNMIAGRISRMKDLPPRSRAPRRSRAGKVEKRDPFAWVTGPKPAWGTPAADALVAEAKARFITQYKINTYFGVSDNMVDAALRRAKAIPDPTDIPDEMRPFLPFVSAEWPMSRITKLVTAWTAGHPISEIMAKCNSTHSSAQKKIERLCRAGLLKARPMGNLAKKVAKPPTPKKTPNDTPPVHRPLGSANGGRTAHFLGTLINWRVVNEMKIEHAPGRCRWPLTCNDETNGKFCQHHSGLLGRRAT